MKRRSISLIGLFLGMLIVGISIWRSRVPVVTMAADEVTVSGQAEEDISVDVTETEEETEDYSLPYPGILPDHPLYFLKMLRDKVQLWLTKDSLARAELILSYADKRIASALALAEKGKSGLAISTADEAEKYLVQAKDEISREEISESESMNFLNKFYKAVDKHEKVLMGIASRVPEESLPALEEAEMVRAGITDNGLEASGAAEPEDMATEEAGADL